MRFEVECDWSGASGNAGIHPEVGGAKKHGRLPGLRGTNRIIFTSFYWIQGMYWPIIEKDRIM